MACTLLRDEMRAFDGQRDHLQSGAPVWKPIVMQAKHQTPCSHCHLSISPGNAIYPWGNYTGYMHLSCALKEADEAGMELQPPVCKHWSRRGYCLYKEKCFYRHPPEALPSQEPVAAASQPDAKTNQAQRKSNRGIGKRNLVRNAFRASVFRRFLIDTFGREVLGRGSGVLDVAGGKGELSYELVNLNNIASTVIEPRALQLWRQHKWMLKGYYHRNVNFQTYVDVPHTAFTSGQHATVDPPHLRMVFDAAIINSLLQPAQQPSNSSAQAGTPAVTHKPTSPGSVGSVPSSDGSPAQTYMTRSCASHTGAADCQPLASSHAAAVTDLADSAQASGGLQTEHLSAERPLQQSNTRLAEADISWAECQQGLLAVQCDADPSQACCSSSACSEAQHMGSAGASQRELEAEASSQAGEEAAGWDAVLKHSMKLARNIKWTHKGLQHEHEDGATWSDTEPAEDAAAQAAEGDADSEALQSQEELRDGPTDITDSQQAWDTIHHCSVIVGMHPDQAAEPIIDFAQRTQRPFAMVPCCVYPAEFPHRRLPDGTLVRKYEQLIEYMQSRSPCIKVATLPFEGRNQVVYCTSWL